MYTPPSSNVENMKANNEQNLLLGLLQFFGVFAVLFISITMILVFALFHFEVITLEQSDQEFDKALFEFIGSYSEIELYIANSLIAFIMCFISSWIAYFRVNAIYTKFSLVVLGTIFIVALPSWQFLSMSKLVFDTAWVITFISAVIAILLVRVLKGRSPNKLIKLTPSGAAH